MLTVLLSLILALSVHAQDKPDAHSTFVSSLLTQLTSVARDPDSATTRASICKLVGNHVDIKALAHLSLGINRRGVSDAKLQEFYGAFHALTTTNFIRFFSRVPMEKATVDTKAKVVADNQNSIGMSVQRPNAEDLKFVFFIVTDADKNLRIIDAALGGKRYYDIVKNRLNQIISNASLEQKTNLTNADDKIQALLNDILTNNKPCF